MYRTRARLEAVKEQSSRSSRTRHLLIGTSSTPFQANRIPASGLQENRIPASDLCVRHTSRPTLLIQEAKASKLQGVVFDGSHCRCPHTERQNDRIHHHHHLFSLLVLQWLIIVTSIQILLCQPIEDFPSASARLGKFESSQEPTRHVGRYLVLQSPCVCQTRVFVATFLN